MGGSLGAKSINEAIDSQIGAFESNHLQLIWQTGRLYADKAARSCAGRKNIWTGDFINRMEYAFSAADLVISRSGAMSVAELSVAGKPVIFVPFPFAAEDHQTANAKTMVDQNAGVLIRDEETSQKLVSAVIALSKDQTRLEELGKNISRLAVTGADKAIAQEILHIIN